MITLSFSKNGESKIVSVDENSNKTLLEVAHENGVELLGACDGACACGTCHVYIDQEHLALIERAGENEENVLDIVFGLQDNSRLACQVVVCKELDGAIIEIPD
jgi:ferredoxin